MNRNTRKTRKTRKTKGFTLIELVIAMVIAGILAAIAIPAYSNYVRQSRRTDAKTALLDLASLEERYFSTANVYSQSPSDLGYPGATWPVTVGSGYYTVSQTAFAAATTTNPASYSFTATAIGDQAKDAQCQTFTVTSTGVQSATPDPTNTCWH
jgi:type IV pilus assembly protein PilE